jgi:DNA-binding transcriptional MerR regulator/methylmalonyl-CoA mutase cobalamin-binding subunit
MTTRGDFMPRPPRFTIRAASALTGINQNTLRAWERRHGLIQPARTPKGYRLYSDDDIEWLRLIQRALAEGVSVGRVRAYLEAPGTLEQLRGQHAPRHVSAARGSRVVAVSLAEAELKGTTAVRLSAGEPPHGNGAPALAPFVERMEQAALRFDRTDLERAFTRAVGLFSLRHAFHDALAPALTRVAQRCVDHLADAASERFLAAFAREKLLGALAGLRPLHQQPRALFACLAGGQHEITLMLLSLEVGLEGVSALYLGADAPGEAVVQAARAAGSRAVALSGTLDVPQQALLHLRDRLAALPRHPRVLVGGPAAPENRDWLEANGFGVLPLDTEEAAAQVLRAIGRD